MAVPSRFAQRVYYFAAIYGLIVLLPQYFLESKLVPPTTHPEQFYGFVGIALAWQFVFLLIARDAVHYRSLMPITVLEKLAFGLPVLILYAQARVAVEVLVVGCIDLLLALLFVLAFVKVRRSSAELG